MDTLPNEIVSYMSTFLNNVELSLFSCTCNKFINITDTCAINDIGLYSAECGNIEILEYALFHKYVPTLALSSMAAEKGHYVYLKYLKEKSYPINTVTNIYAAKGKCKKILELLDVDVSDPLFFEEVFCTGDIDFVKYVLDKYRCGIKIMSTKCTSLNVLELLLDRNIISELFFEIWPRYHDIIQARKLDTLVAVFKHRISVDLKSGLMDILRRSIITYDTAWLESVLDNDVLFPVTTMTYKEKISSFHNLNDGIIFNIDVMFNTSKHMLPMIKWLSDTIGIPNHDMIWANLNNFDVYVWLTNMNIHICESVTCCVMRRCIVENNDEGIEYFKENHKKQVVKYAMGSALSSGNIDLADWVLKNGYVFKTDDMINMCSCAVASRKIVVVRFFVEVFRRYIKNIRFLVHKACESNVEILQYVCSEFNYVLSHDNYNMTSVAIRHGHMDMIKWLCENECPKSTIYIGDCERNRLFIGAHEYELNHIAKYDDVKMLWELRMLGFKYSDPFRERSRELFAAKCYIYMTEDEPYDTQTESYDTYTEPTMYYNFPNEFKRTFVPTISELNNYVCNHVFCKDHCGSVRCLYKGMLEIMEYEKAHKLFA